MYASRIKWSAPSRSKVKVEFHYNPGLSQGLSGTSVQFSTYGFPFEIARISAGSAAANWFWAFAGALAQQLLVSVRDRFGEPLSEQAVVTLSEPGGGQVAVANTGNLPTAVSTAVFQLNPGEYDIEVDAVGYDRGTEHASLGREHSNMVTYVYLVPAGSSKPAAAANGVVFTPKVQHELDKSLVALRQNKYEEARKHLQKAQQMVPSNPDIMYLMGLVDYTAKDVSAARKQFEMLLATYPTYERGLVMLGEIEFEAKEYKDASVTLQRAVEGGTNNWRAHYLLALACVRTGELSKAAIEAMRTADLNQEKAPPMKLLIAKILLVQGKNPEAQKAFESYLREYPRDGGVPEAKKYLEGIEEAKKSVSNADRSESPVQRFSATA